MSKIVFKEESYRIIGVCMKVHNALGSGFKEAVYEEALEKELEIRSIDYKRQVRLPIYYNDEKLKKYYVADFVCCENILLEIKATEYIIKEHEKQLLNYLKTTRMPLGKLINFGEPSLRYRRYVC